MKKNYIFLIKETMLHFLKQSTVIATLWMIFIIAGYAQCNHPDDYKALRALYLATDGDNWTNKTGWPSKATFNANPTTAAGTDMSKWYGIQCVGGRVTCIDMDGALDCFSSVKVSNGNNLVGVIPDSINQLNQMQYLSLSKNKLTGSIPNLALPFLSQLDLCENQLSGTIPNFNLPNLQSLIIDKNQLSGFNQNFDLPNLTILSIRENQLSGPIPNFNLPNLQWLDLYLNQLSDTIPNFKFPNLEVLRLNGNKLNGTVPNFTLSNLKELSLSFNQLTGKIPNFNLPNLGTLDLGFNQLTGEIPNFNLPNLEGLYLSSNQLTGTIPNFNLPNLTSLGLSSNQLTGEIPNFNFPNLIWLFLSYNQLSGTIPNFDLPNLESLQLYNNQLSGSIPNFNLPNLHNLWLNNNQFIGCLPTNFKKYCDSIEVYSFTGKLIKVKPKIYLYNNPLLPWQGDFSKFCATDGSLAAQRGAPCNNGNAADGSNDVIQDDCSCGTMPPCSHPDYAPLIALYDSTNGPGWTIKTGWEAGKAGTSCDPCNFNGQPWYGIQCENGRVTKIILPLNKLSGTIPNFNILDLLYLNLSDNQLKGTIPNFNLPKLREMNLTTNLLTGNIPNFNLPNLQSMFLSQNQLSGNIPNFNLPNLIELFISSNQLSGSIPKELGRLQKLSVLTFENNQLSGEIPKELAQLSYLRYLNLNYNNLSGCIDSTLKIFCTDSVKNDTFKIVIDLSNNPLLPWQGDFSKFCATDGSLAAQRGAPCNNGNAADGSNDVIGVDCTCGAVQDTFFINIPHKTGEKGSSVCLDVTAKNFKNIESVWFNLSYNATLAVPQCPAINIHPGLKGSIFGDVLNCNSKDKGFVFFSYTGNPTSIPDNEILFTLCFDLIGEIGASTTISLHNMIEYGACRNISGKSDCKISLKIIDGSITINDPCSHPDLAGLLSFYRSTNGQNWSNNTGWKEGASGTSCDPCNHNGQSWYGIQCENGRVTELNLISNNLAGTIPDSINLLSQIKNLTLTNNKLTGSIPNFIIPNLERLEVSENQLSGSIPNFDLPNLTSLLLISNQLSGSVPNFNLPKLWRLDLGNNQLSGTIPNFSLPNLARLQLGSNQLSGAIPNFNLPNLQWLDLSANQLRGFVPNFNLTSLSEIILVSNQLSGTVPNFNLPKLTLLDISNNQLSGTIPNFNLPNLSDLRLANNQLSGQLPNFNLPNLNNIFLYRNQFIGCIPSDYKKYCNSNALVFLYENPLLPWQGDFSKFCATDGSLAAQRGASCDNGNAADGTNDVIQDDCSCGAMPPCTHLDFAPLMALYDSTNGSGWTNKTGWEAGKAGMSCDPCNFNGQPWYGIQCEGGRVTCIDLDGIADCGYDNKPGGNGLSGILPNLNLPKLFYLNLGNNKITGNIPNFNLPELNAIYLYQNNFSGSLPNFNMPKLFQFEMRNNKLTGSIPNFNMPLLGRLDLSDNQLSGSIPNFNMPKLQQFILDKNSLSGIIPNFNMPILEYLLLGNNQLSGSIPNFNMPTVKYFGLDYNQLSGPIPNFSFPNVIGLSLNNNQLSGCFPAFVCNIQDFNSSDNLLLPWKGDHKPFCSGLAQIGASCDDGDSTTTNDVIQVDCSCKGLPCGSHPDFAPLMALYDSTNGPGWTNKSGWEAGKAGMSCDPCNYNGEAWYGLQCENGRVTRIDLSANNLMGNIPSKIGNLDNLLALHLSANKVNGEIPGELGKLSKLQYLFLSENQLTGTIPTEIGKLTKLKYLWLFNNQLSGGIPVEIGNLAELKEFFIFSNKLTGNIPKEIGNLISLEKMSMFNNPLSGPIPKEIGKLLNLTSAELMGINLTGSIPAEILNLSKLNVLWLQDNNLEGCIDPNFKIFCNKSVNFSNNPLLPWQGDFAKFCATDGSLAAQRGASCDNGNAGDGNVDVIDQNCNCVPGCRSGFAIMTGSTVVCTGAPTTWTASGGMSYKWSNGVTTAANILSGVGRYTVTVTDTNGCTNTVSQVLTNNFKPSLTIESPKEVCDGDSTILILNFNTQDTPIYKIGDIGPAGGIVFYDKGNEMDGWRYMEVSQINNSSNYGTGCYCTNISNTSELVGKGLENTIIWNNQNCAGEFISGSLNYATNNYDDWFLPSKGELEQIYLNLHLNGIGGFENQSYWSSSTAIYGGCDIDGGAWVMNFSNGNFMGEYRAGFEGAGFARYVRRFSATSNLYNYRWSTGSTSSTISFKAQKNASYTITVTDNHGCTSSLSKQINVKNLPVIKIAGVTQICAGGSATLTATGGNTYSWSSGATGNNITIISAGKYVVTVTDINGCTARDSVTVIILDTGKQPIPQDDTLYVEEGIFYDVDLLANDLLYTQNNTVRYGKNPGKDVRFTSQSPDGKVKVYADRRFTEAVRLTYEICDQCDNCASANLLILPEKLKNITQTTLITPLESANNTLQFSQVPISDSELWVYNRWGQQIYHAKGYQNDWDGDGYPAGVYYYVFKVYGFTIKKALTVVK